jgi:hypothetical protein
MSARTEWRDQLIKAKVALRNVEMPLTQDLNAHEHKEIVSQAKDYLDEVKKEIKNIETFLSNVYVSIGQNNL